MAIKIPGLGNPLGGSGAMQSSMTNAAKQSGMNLAMKYGNPLLEKIGLSISKTIMDQALSRGDPRLSHTWDVKMPLGFDSSYVEGIEYTGNTRSRRNVFRGGQMLPIPGIISPGLLRITFYEDEALTTRAYLNKLAQKLGPTLSGNAATMVYNQATTYRQKIVVTPMTSNWAGSGTITFYATFLEDDPGFIFNSEVKATSITATFAVSGMEVVVEDGSLFGAALRALGLDPADLGPLAPLVKTAGAQLGGIGTKMGNSLPVKVGRIGS